MEQRPLGIGIIGAGRIIKRHASAYRSLPEWARLVAVADVDLKRAEAAGNRFDFEHVYDDYHEMLDRNDVDVVDVCTPANHHAPMVIDGLKAGKHVLCEKPMATTLAEADDIISAADQHTGLTVSFVFQFRSDPTHRRVRLMIEQGDIGRVLVAGISVWIRKKPSYYSSAPGRGSWKTDGGGVLINQAVHQLDALISFLGCPVEASAVMDTFVHPMEAEDTLAGWVKFNSGAFATIDCTVCAHNKNFKIEVLGENAGVWMGGDPDARSFDWKVNAPNAATRRALHAKAMKRCPPPADPYPWTVAVQKMMCKIQRREWIPPTHWGHTPFIGEFLRAVRAGSQGPMPPREARRSLELAAALYESALTHCVVSLPLDTNCRLYRGVDPKKMGKSTQPGSQAEPVPTVSGTRAEPPSSGAPEKVAGR